jgi:hypothetical protein
VHHGMRTPTSVAVATSSIMAGEVAPPDSINVAPPEGVNGASPAEGRAPSAVFEGPAPEEDGPGRIVREKEHPAKPMTIDQALFEMELVGHDFYLFSDADTGQPSVVYRRKGYAYGVIRLSS